jgi:4'-phosphopantetheinyl transferase
VLTDVRIARIELREPAGTGELLARALGVTPDTLEISRVCARCGHPTHGKPVIAGGPAFSVSHTDGLGVVALAPPGTQVGVDVERVRPRARLEQLAARVLGVDALARWRGLPERDRLEAFLLAWSAKEAYLKALGIGVTTRLADVPDAVEGWTIGAIDMGDGYVGAFAVDRPGVIPSDGTAG